MRTISAIAVVLGTLLAPVATAAASERPSKLVQPRPSWFTKQLAAKVHAAGTKGVEVRFSRRERDQLQVNCLGTAPPYAGADGVSITAVSAGTCMVAPHGCTMNFVFTDGSSKYIGTAGHCVQGGGNVVAQIATRVDPTDTLIVTLASIGKAVKKVNQGIGADFALVKINPGFKVVPGVSGALGPTGAFCGDPVGQPVMHYGHGYVFFVEQGNAKFGEVIPDLSLIFRGDWEDGFNWVGYGLPGDSGSGVMNAAGLAVGDLTHGIGVAGLPVPGLNMGMTMEAIMRFIGPGYSLVTADGRGVKCAGGPVGV